MGPRRISAALAVLALGLLLATAGVAAASSSSPGTGHDHLHDQQGPENRDLGPADGWWRSRPENPRFTEHPVPHAPPSGHPSDGSTAPHDDGNPQEEPPSGGGVNATGFTPAGVPQTPVSAPAAAVNGPAPATAAAAPILSAGGVVAAGATDGTSAADAATGNVGATGIVGATAETPAPTPAETPTQNAAEARAELPAETAAPTPLAPVADAFPLAGLPQLRTLGEVAASVADGPSTARVLLATPAGRSLAVLVGLVLAIVLFLSVHRRLDRDDPKLAVPHSGPDVARFR